MSGILRLIIRAFLSACCVLCIIPVMSVTWLTQARKMTRKIMQAAFAFGVRVWGMDIKVTGTLAQGRPLLLVSNHFSYLDVFVLGSQIPTAFTPKKEIASWPVIGVMCKAAGCLFIDRRLSKTMSNKQDLDKALACGDIIQLFPESTTNDGTKLLPFKSSFFSLAENNDMDVQPVSIVYTTFNGKPLTPAHYASVGWYGDALFFPHLIQFLQQKSLRVVLVLHPPVRGKDFASRKALAAYCHDVIDKPLLAMRLYR